MALALAGLAHALPDLLVAAVTELALLLLALGVLASAMTRSQLVALLITIGIEFGLFVLGIGEYIFDEGLLHDISAHVSMASQMEELSRGLVDLRRVVFDLSLMVASLFVTTRVVDSWRWG